LNANTWDNGHTPNADAGTPFTKKQPQHDNRAGFAFGGPFWKNKTFFFGNYEIRRFPQSVEVERIVPTDTLRTAFSLSTTCNIPLLLRLPAVRPAGCAAIRAESALAQPFNNSGT